jgi:hypothetical protein
VKEVKPEESELSSSAKATVLFIAIITLVALAIGACQLSDHYAKPQVITGVVTAKMIAGTNQTTSLDMLTQGSQQHVEVTKEQFDQVKAGQLVLVRCLVGVIGDPRKCRLESILDATVGTSNF